MDGELTPQKEPFGTPLKVLVYTKYTIKINESLDKTYKTSFRRSAEL